MLIPQENLKNRCSEIDYEGISEPKYHIRTNVGGYNIWRFVKIMDLARY